jgi:hypothetical protein
MAKKKRRRRSAGSGAEAQQRRLERLDARRQAKAEQLEARRKAQQRARFIRIALLFVLFMGVSWFFFFRQTKPASIAGHEIQSFDDAGLQVHAAPYEYESNPPVAGPHSPNVAPCGTYAQPIPDPQYVHSLEHGAVGIMYRPDLDPADISTIEGIVREFDGQVLSQPDPDMPTAMAVTSWGEMMRLDALDESAIRRYIETFRGEGPESGAECPSSSTQSFEPPAPRDS